MPGIAVANRGHWAAAGAVLLGALVLLLAIAVWLPGPRRALPSIDVSGSASSPAGSPSETRSPSGLPNPDLTPGSVNPNVTQDNIMQTVCLAGWTKSVRPPSAYTAALKLVQIVEYRYADKAPSHYQEDHLVPLEIGGAPRDPRNLWPQPEAPRLGDGTAVGWAAKDELEDYLHSAVCAETIQLGDAQRLIAGDWVAAWISAGMP